MSREIILGNPILWYVIFFTNCFLTALFFYVLLGKKVNIKKIIIFSFISSLGIIFIRLTLPFNFSVLTGITLLILLCIFILKFKPVTSVVIVFVAQIATTLGEIIAILFNIILSVQSEDTLNKTGIVIFDNFITSIILIFIILTIYYFKIKINFSTDITKKKYIGILLNAIITFFIIFPNIAFFWTSDSDISVSIIIFNIVSIAIFFSLCSYNINMGAKLNIKESELEYQKLYNKTLNDFIDGLRTFKHDFANTLSSIGGYLSLNDLEGLKKYFSELVSDYNSINNLSFVNSTIINNPSIYGLIVSKLYLAETKGIKVNIDITTDLNNSEMKIYELCKILGIFLDNAIEAAQGSVKKFINITFKPALNENGYIIIIENSFSGNVKINHIFKKGFSSKGKDRGIGLWEVKSITNKYKTVNLKTSVINGLFRQELFL